MTRFHKEFQTIARSLSRLELMETSMSAEPLHDDLLMMQERESDRRYLDFYGDIGLRKGLERYGMIQKFGVYGFFDLQLNTQANDERHTLSIDARHPAEPGLHRIFESVIRRDELHLQPHPVLPPLPETLEGLTVDWMLLQHPLRPFEPSRPRLPGQDHPGLGIGAESMEITYRTVARLGMDVMLTVAAHFHNAWMYLREMPFFDPFYHAQFRVLEHMLLKEEGLNLAQASWAVHWNCVVDEKADEEFHWRGEAQMRPRNTILHEYLDSEEYKKKAFDYRGLHKFRLLRSKFDELWREHWEQESLTMQPRP